MVKYCKFCGTEIDPGVLFCPGCGQLINEENVTDTPRRPTVVLTPEIKDDADPGAHTDAPERAESSGEEMRPEKKKQSAFPAYLLIVLSVVFIAEFFIAGLKYPGFLVGGGKEGETASDVTTEAEITTDNATDEVTTDALTNDTEAAADETTNEAEVTTYAMTDNVEAATDELTGEAEAATGELTGEAEVTTDAPSQSIRENAP